LIEKLTSLNKILLPRTTLASSTVICSTRPTVRKQHLPQFDRDLCKQRRTL